MTGFSIGCVTRCVFIFVKPSVTQDNSALSVKWVGLFVTCLVGVYTIEDLWDKFGDLKMPIVSVIVV